MSAWATEKSRPRPRNARTRSYQSSTSNRPSGPFRFSGEEGIDYDEYLRREESNRLANQLIYHPAPKQPTRRARATPPAAQPPPQPLREDSYFRERRRTDSPEFSFLRDHGRVQTLSPGAEDEGWATDQSPSSLASTDSRQKTIVSRAAECERRLQKCTRICDERAQSGKWSAFADLAARIEDFIFRLEVWVSEAELDLLPSDELDPRLQTRVSEILKSMSHGVKSMAQDIKTAPAPLKPLPKPSLEDLPEDEDDSDSEDISDPESLATVRIEQCMKSVDLQLRSLRRLTRTLRETRKTEPVLATAARIQEIQRYFGTEEACNANRKPGVPASAALKQARG